jgi:hypothetical protein
MKFIGAAALATRQRRERRHGPFDRNEAFAVVERLQFAEWAFYGTLAKEARRRSYLAVPSMFIRQTMLMRESAALV